MYFRTSDEATSVALRLIDRADLVPMASHLRRRCIDLRIKMDWLVHHPRVSAPSLGGYGPACELRREGFNALRNFIKRLEDEGAFGFGQASAAVLPAAASQEPETRPTRTASKTAQR